MSGGGNREAAPAVSLPPQPSLSRRRTRVEVAEALLAQLRARGAGIDVDSPGFAEGIRQHFENLPSRCDSRPPPPRAPGRPRSPPPPAWGPAGMRWT